MKFFLGIIFFLSSVGGYAKDRPILSLLVEKSLPTGLQQTSIDFFSDSVVFVTNTNLWQKNDEKIELGYFTAKKNETLKLIERELLGLRKRMPAEPKKKTFSMSEYVSPHADKIKLDGRVIALANPLRAGYFDFFTRIWTAGEWEAKRGAEVTKSTNVFGVEVEQIGKEEVKRNARLDSCTKRTSDTTFCKIHNFGYVYFGMKPTFP